VPDARRKSPEQRANRGVLRALEKRRHFHNRCTPKAHPPQGHATRTSEADMLDKLTQKLDFQGNALLLRAERQRVISSNIANADTPGYVARDFKFADAMRAAAREQAPNPMRQQSVTDPRHIPLPTPGADGGQSTLAYAVQTQPSLDNNSVDMDRERAAFVNNAVRYEATLRFINGNVNTMLSAIKGQ
jgi:flagellar basal-body rod protein FlgB